MWPSCGQPAMLATMAQMAASLARLHHSQTAPYQAATPHHGTAGSGLALFVSAYLYIAPATPSCAALSMIYDDHNGVLMAV